MEEGNLAPAPSGPTPIPCRPLIFSACRRFVGATCRDWALEPEITVKALMTGLDFLGVRPEDRPVAPWVDLSVEAADFGQKVIYPEESTPHPDYADPLIKDVSDYRKLERVDLGKAPRMQNMLEMIRLLVEKGAIGIGGFCLGPLGVLSMMRGAERLFRDCILHPSDVKAALETITETLVEYVEAQCDASATAVALDTLFASWNGLSREQWEEFEGPYAKQMADAVRRKGLPVFIHNCGDGPYFDSQIRSMEPVAISFATLPDDCKDRKELKRRYGDQVALMGYLDTTLLTYGTPYQVMEECRQQIEDLADSPMGYILAPGCEFPPNAPFENALAIMRAAEIYA